MNALSKKALDMLEYNGYSFKQKNGVLVFRKGYDYIPILIISFLLLLALPILFSIHFLFVIGAVLFVSGLIYLHKKHLSKSATFIIESEKSKMSFQNRKGSRRFLFKHIKSIFLHSRFKTEYSSAFKSTNEEHEITLGFQLHNDEALKLFSFISDHAKPSKEMNEVHDFLETVIKHRVK